MRRCCFAAALAPKSTDPTGGYATCILIIRVVGRSHMALVSEVKLTFLARWPLCMKYCAAPCARSCVRSRCNTAVERRHNVSVGSESAYRSDSPSDSFTSSRVRRNSGSLRRARSCREQVQRGPSTARRTQSERRAGSNHLTEFLFVPARHRLRQPNSCCGLRSCRRAISDTFTRAQSPSRRSRSCPRQAIPGADPHP